MGEQRGVAALLLNLRERRTVTFSGCCNGCRIRSLLVARADEAPSTGVANKPGKGVPRPSRQHRQARFSSPPLHRYAVGSLWIHRDHPRPSSGHREDSRSCFGASAGHRAGLPAAAALRARRASVLVLLSRPQPASTPTASTLVHHPAAGGGHRLRIIGIGNSPAILVGSRLARADRATPPRGSAPFLR